MKSLFIALLVTLAFFATAAAQTGYRISGVVENGVTNVPVPKCQLSVRNDDPEAASRSIKTLTTTSDGGGHFSFDGLATGKYSLTARCNHFVAQSLDEHEGFTSAVAVGPDKESTNIVFRLSPSASITGRIQDEFGDPVIDAGVLLFRRSSTRETGRASLRNRANTDHGGFYHFYRLPPGEYLIAVIARPWYARYQPPVDFSREDGAPPVDDGEADLNLTFPITYYSAATDSTSAQPIRLQPGDRTTADMVLSALPSTEIRIPLAENTDESVRRTTTHELQTSILGAPVNVFPMVESMNNGKLDVIRGVAPGDYVMQSHNLMSPLNGGAAQSTSESLNYLRVSASGAEFKQTIAATPVIGSVELEGTRKVLRPTTIRFQKIDGAVVDARTTTNGALEPFHLFPGVYEYSAFSQQGVIKSLESANAKVVARTIEIADKPVTVKVTLADIATKISGTVLGVDGKPLSGAMVILVPQDLKHSLNIVRRDQSDSDGTFTLRVVMPGTYRLLALQDAWDAEWSNPKVLTPFLASAPALDIPPNSPPLNLSVKVQRVR